MPVQAGVEPRMTRFFAGCKAEKRSRSLTRASDERDAARPFEVRLKNGMMSLLAKRVSTCGQKYSRHAINCIIRTFFSVRGLRDGGRIGLLSKIFRLPRRLALSVGCQKVKRGTLSSPFPFGAPFPFERRRLPHKAD